MGVENKKEESRSCKVATNDRQFNKARRRLLWMSVKRLHSYSQELNAVLKGEKKRIPNQQNPQTKLELPRRSAERKGHLQFIWRSKLKQGWISDRRSLQNSLGFGLFVIVPKRQYCNCKYSLQIKIITTTCVSSFTVLPNCMCSLGSRRAGSAIRNKQQSGEKKVQSF